MSGYHFLSPNAGCPALDPNNCLAQVLSLFVKERQHEFGLQTHDILLLHLSNGNLLQFYRVHQSAAWATVSTKGYP
jgi:hypothetical protein